MKRITQFSIIGGLVSIILLVFKSSQSSKILAATSLLVFIYIYFGTKKSEDIEI